MAHLVRLPCCCRFWRRRRWRSSGFPRPTSPTTSCRSTTVPPPRAELFRVSRSGGAGVLALCAGFVLGHREAFAAGAVRLDHRLAGLARLLARGLHLSGRIDPERHAGAVRSDYALPWTVAAVFALPILVHAVFRPHVLRRRLPAGGGAGTGRAAAGQRARLARPGTGPAGLRLSRGGRAVCRHRHGVRHLPLRSVRRLLPPQRAARTCSILGGVLPGGRHLHRPALLPLPVPLRRDSRAGLEGVEVAREDSARRVHPVPAVRGRLPLRRDPRADRGPAGRRSGARPAASGGRCWSSVPC